MTQGAIDAPGRPATLTASVLPAAPTHFAVVPAREVRSPCASHIFCALRGLPPGWHVPCEYVPPAALHMLVLLSRVVLEQATVEASEVRPAPPLELRLLKPLTVPFP